MYKREVEDTELKIKQLKREREALIDLNPSNSTTIISVSDFDEKLFIAKDKELSLKIRDLTITLEILKERYSYLFENPQTVNHGIY